MANGIQIYHGEVSKCSCGIVDHPEKAQERACGFCFNRGFVASCLACEGKGQVTQKMAGGPGTMSATCIACGGAGMFGVNKPEGWTDEPVAAEEPTPDPEPVPPAAEPTKDPAPKPGKTSKAAAKAETVEPPVLVGA